MKDELEGKGLKERGFTVI